MLLYCTMDIFEIESVLSKLYWRKKDVTLAEIPEDLKKDFNVFFIGKTFTLHDNTPHFYYHDFVEWFHKVVYHKGITD